jgi:hypothetical protein
VSVGDKKGNSMNTFEAEQARRQIEQDFEALGEELGMEGRCVAGWYETSVTLEEGNGNQHHFVFAPTRGDDE